MAKNRIGHLFFGFPQWERHFFQQPSHGKRPWEKTMRAFPEKQHFTFKSEAYRLTSFHFCNYSHRMINELNALESKIAQVASLCRILRSENSQLRQQLTAAEAEKKGLEERIDSARNRLEQLARQLPESKADA